MREILITILIGVMAGTIDCLPMIKMKMDRYSITSAFVQYLVSSFVIVNTELFGIAWWLKGGVTSLLLAIPMIIYVAKDDKKSITPMLVMSVIIGTLIGIAEHIFL